ncbi:MAG: hypothetical protein AB1758_33110 [Candidatus Eremiobacterota bacterium]
MPSTIDARQNAIRGAKYGAVGLGALSFVSGLFICFAFKLPVPPLACTEFGILIGAGLGAGIGFLGTDLPGRWSLYGALAGVVAGTLFALLVGGAFATPMGILRIALLASLVGWRAGLTAARQRARTPNWAPVEQSVRS